MIFVKVRFWTSDRAIVKNAGPQCVSRRWIGRGPPHNILNELEQRSPPAATQSHCSGTNYPQCIRPSTLVGRNVDVFSECFRGTVHGRCHHPLSIKGRVQGITRARGAAWTPYEVVLARNRSGLLLGYIRYGVLETIQPSSCHRSLVIQTGDTECVMWLVRRT